MIAVALVCVLGIIGLLYALRPLLAPPIAPEEPANDAAVRKTRALEAILDLEADLAAGKLAPEDFAAFKEIYQRDALTAMRELDVASQTLKDTDLEAEIAAARAELR